MFFWQVVWLHEDGRTMETTGKYGYVTLQEAEKFLRDNRLSITGEIQALGAVQILQSGVVFISLTGSNGKVH